MSKSWAALALLAALAAVPASAEEMLVWDKIAAQTLRAEKLPREEAEQTMTLVRAAVDDAMNRASPMNAGLSADLAAAAAARCVLVKLFPARKAKLDARLLRSFHGADPEIAQQAYDIGCAAADAAVEGQWKQAVPRPTGPLGPRIPDQALPSRTHLIEPLNAPKSLKLHSQQL